MAEPRPASPAEAPLHWSVVIPAYDEARRLPRYLEEITGFFDGRDRPYEVIVVDDGSRDATPVVVEAAARLHPAVRLLRDPQNRGKGAAVKRGMIAARGAYRLFADADGATPIAELKRLEGALMAGADVAIGSRGLDDPDVVVTARRHRVLAGRVFNWMVARVGLGDIADSQCGFKAFTAAAADRLFTALVTEGFGFDVELLLRARAAGLRVTEVAVNWTDQAGSKSGLVKDGPTMLWEIAVARARLGR
jgi:dolichyl-phosphate beta-glucosyltransferase